MILYQIATEKQLKKFLKKEFEVDLYDLPMTELKTPLLFGDFVCHKGYKFKKIYSHYQCMETPTEKHSDKKVAIFKNPNDRWKK